MAMTLGGSCNYYLVRVYDMTLHSITDKNDQYVHLMEVVGG